MNTIKDISSAFNESGLSGIGGFSFSSLFRMVAGDRLADCVDIGVPELEDLHLKGSNEDVTKEVYMDTVQICSLEDGGRGDIVVSSERAALLGKRFSNSNINISSCSDVENSIKSYLSVGDFESTIEKAEVSHTSETGDLEDDVMWYDEPEEERVEDLKDLIEDDGEEEDSEEDPKPEVKEEISDLSRKIRQYYSAFYKGIVSELSKRYTGMFASGYEVITPVGILCEEGICSLSGSSRVVKVNSIVSSNMYKIFRDSMNFEELPVRSNVKIADIIYDRYEGGRTNLLYFPNKLLEFTYGRKSPTGDNQDSLNTYEKHAESTNWSAYSAQHVVKNLTNLMGCIVEKFVVLNSENEEYFTEQLAGKLSEFLSYVKDCLSACLLMVEYKSVKDDIGSEDVASFKIRVCDPRNSLGDANYTREILSKAFLGSTGDVPFSYEPRIEMEVCVKEYAHEFNRDISQASPLFAYKALEKIQEQGQGLSWSGMILGMALDGSILRNGTHGINLSTKLTHQICAGSRAGKGVMTLNILASGIVNGKNIFYLDRKPDMASLFKYMCPDMFVINGGGYGEQYDIFTDASGKRMFDASTMDGLVASKTPAFLPTMLGCSPTYTDLGDLVYMRALMLGVGIIAARASGALEDPNLGGKDGILLVVDEFKNFQESHTSLVKTMLGCVPPAIYDDLQNKLKIVEEKKKLKQEEGKSTLNEDAEIGKYIGEIESSFPENAYYALSYINSMVESVKRLSKLKDAGFVPEENELSDIFVIGQHLKYGECEYAAFDDALANNSSSERYRSAGRFGVKSKDKLNLASGSFAYSMVNVKTVDAFFGRNMDEGRSVYLAQTNSESKAKGKLDDKASNFAYMETFTEDKRKKIVRGEVRDNVSLANSCVYFKPFLILNDSNMDGECVGGMFARCAGPDPSHPWISREQLIADNPSYNDPSKINEAVGFIDYMKMAGCSDVSGVLAKSGVIANYVVNAMGYGGSWLEFITDLRPEWIFTVEDVMNAVTGKPVALQDPENNPVVKEYARVFPEVFGLSKSDDIMDSGIDSSESLAAFGYSEPEIEDDIEAHDSYNDAKFKSLFGDEVGVEDDEEIDLGFDIDDEGSNNKVIDEDDFYEDIKEGIVEETGFGDLGENEFEYEDREVVNNSGFKKSEMKELMALLAGLKKFGINLDVNSLGIKKDPYEGMTGGWAEPDEFMQPAGGYARMDRRSVIDRDYEYTGELENLQDLVQFITNDIIQMFGGTERMQSFKVIGGSILVNGYYYRCRVGDIFVRHLPYDIKRQINSGNISSLFDYRMLSHMSNLRDLEFDSKSFVYDYVSPALGFGNTISVDKFFDYFHALQVFTLGRNRFKRSTYMDMIRDSDEFYNPRKCTQIADASEKMLSNVSKRSWDYTKNTMKSKQYGKLMKVAGVTAGATVAAGSKAAQVGSKVGRSAAKGIKNVISSIREASRATDRM